MGMQPMSTTHVNAGAIVDRVDECLLWKQMVNTEKDHVITGDDAQIYNQDFPMKQQMSA